MQVFRDCERDKIHEDVFKQIFWELGGCTEEETEELVNELKETYIPKVQTAFSKAMKEENLMYALESIRDLILQLLRIWQITMLLVEANWCIQNNHKSTKLDSATLLLKGLKYMRLEEDHEEDQEFRYI